jgi:RNA polymerase sigma factor (sigma-70 family)
MVWGICYRVLSNHHDAEDAFQVTFLVLVRKAASIASRELLANWLCRVAFQTALKVRSTAAKRRIREKQITELPEPELAPKDIWHDLQPLLDQELSRLPDKYRISIVLCDLEGKTRKEAAQQLGCPEGTVAGRLARARTMLAKRLARHGLLSSGGSLAVLLSQNAASACVPISMMTTTIKTVTLVTTGQVVATAKIAALTEGVLKAMLMTKLKAGAMALLMLGIVAFTCGMLAHDISSAKVNDVERHATKSNEKAKETIGDKKNALTVTIKPQKYRVRVKEPFKVDLRVVNSSASTQSFQVQNCWDEQWKSSNDRVSWEGLPEGRNREKTVKLEPGEAHEGTLSKPMLLLAGKPQEKVTFKMGFTPLGSKQTIWSHEVTLTVEPDDKSEKEMAKLQGTWKAVSVERDGKPISEEEVKKLDIRLTIKGDNFMWMPLASKGPEHFPHGQFKLDTTKKPKAIDLTIALPFNPSKKTTTVLGIYEVDGDKLKLLKALPGQERPTEFKTTLNSRLEVIVFKRVKS